jgi:hypothetical protein
MGRARRSLEPNKQALTLRHDWAEIPGRGGDGRERSMGKRGVRGAAGRGGVEALAAVAGGEVRHAGGRRIQSRRG